MDLRTAALKIAYNSELLQKLPAELLEDWGVSGEPVQEGQTSVVFRSSPGRMVAFTPNGYAAEVARQAHGSSVLPEIFRSEVVQSGRDEFSAIEMEELRPLSKAERKSLSDVWIARSEPESRLLWTPAEKAMESKSKDLFSRMEKEGVKHHDMVTSNVAWGSDGSLKLIDLDSVEFI